MFPEQLQKILDLIKKTGDRVVIFDSRNPDDSYVVMDFNNYANQAARGASAPAAAPSHNSPEPAAPKAELSPMSAKSDNLTEEDLTDKINREISMWKNGESSPYLAEENKGRPGWKIPPSVKDKAQEVKE